MTSTRTISSTKSTRRLGEAGQPNARRTKMSGQCEGTCARLSRTHLWVAYRSPAEVRQKCDWPSFSANSSTEHAQCSGSRSRPLTVNGDSSLAQVRYRYPTLHQRLSRSGCQRGTTAVPSRLSPFEYFSVIVAQELRAGVQRPQERKALERYVLKVFQRANRTITPSADAWHRSGDLLAEMAREEGLETARVSKAFANDVLLALSCREADSVLVTDNERDFQRIRRFVEFDFTKPWPGGQVC